MFGMNSVELKVS